ncbi:hypothetical protein KFL_006480020 [Klebsormidium nitens]|uniref:Uncharacterized protein n=1 Tax=Klebsormidium nitens TaxID=105231 RepID=A0A1Y1IPF4_KLENI|nr:hypothetical protein KFL_006480020 [Klebsormidium nitens]|eukprot:GAQ90497.1 hypothetical protein KFL_006480020 [Klebsormidium nitens]
MAARFRAILQAVKVVQGLTRALREMKPRARSSVSRNAPSSAELEAALEFSDSSDAGVPKLDPDVVRRWEHQGEVATWHRERRRFSLRVVTFAYVMIATTSLAQYWAMRHRRKRMQQLANAELPPDGEMT